MTSEYAIAITTYVLSLAKSPAAGDALKLLLTKAKRQGGSILLQNVGMTTKLNDKDVNSQ